MKVIIKIINREVAAKKHIEELRKKKFSIGSKRSNPLTQDLHHAVTSLSAELYTKDVHFLMELIQNAEDNQYDSGVEPTLEFALTTKDVTRCGAQETLLVFNNEVGFSRQNMDSICSVGRSTKKGMRKKGFIGEKGIGFKSVFLVSKLPHIVSNGYKVKFSEEPDKDCGIGYIVPEWISDESFVSKIQTVYGSETLPTTTIVLPLKNDKVDSVKKELSSLHPELLLFLSKLSRLNVHENGNGPNSVTAISIASNTNHMVSSVKDADSRVIHLSVKDKQDVPAEICKYFLWRQSFPVTSQAKVSGREDVKEWILSLAFPFGKRLKRGTSSVGVFAFLPTSMVTNFPFVIQADFLLASSRESILFDSKWNQGIIECIPVAFFNAFMSCVKQGSPILRVDQPFQFLPVLASPYPLLNVVRETIRKKLCDAVIVPCDLFNYGITHCKPSLALRIHPSFRELLIKMNEAGVSLSGISTMKAYALHSSIDQDKYRQSLDFLGIHYQNVWYGKCITVCNLVLQASDDMYIDLLYVISKICYPLSQLSSFCLLKVTNERGEIKLCSVVGNMVVGLQFCYCVSPRLHAWLQKSNIQFGFSNFIYFLPDFTQAALTRHPKCKEVSTWLSNAGVRTLSAFEYCSQICNYISHKGKLSDVITFSHFLYHCYLKNFLTDSDIASISRSMPIIDGSGSLRYQRAGTLVTASGSKWVKLFGPKNPFVQYADISEKYAPSGKFAGEHTPKEELLNFLTSHAGARDLPEISLPDSPVPVAFLQMNSEQAFLLLDWIRFHKTRGANNIPGKFIDSIRCGRWMKTKTGIDCPRNCMIPTENGKMILESMKDVLSGFSIVDEEFYGEQISLYIDELQFLGVQCGICGVLKMLMDRFKILASSTVKREAAISLLLFIGFLKERKMLDEQWLNTMSHAKWLKTYESYGAPKDSVFFKSDVEAEAAHLVTSLQVVDGKFYGGKLHSYLDELKLLGLKFGSKVYSLAAEYLSFPEYPVSITSDCGLFILNCLKNMKSSPTSVLEKVCGTPWLKTSIGYKFPSNVILGKQDCACLLKIVGVPVIDEDFYGEDIQLYVDELKKIGVAVELGDVMKIVIGELKTLLSLPVEVSKHLVMLLHCIKELKETTPSVLADLCESLKEEEFLKTRHGPKKPRETILFNLKWASISFFVDLPLIDDSYYGNEIYGLKEELQMLGVLSSLEEGAMYIARGLRRRIEPSLLSADGTLSLLHCLKKLMDDESADPCLNTFIENMTNTELFMTSCGHRLPRDSILLLASWKGMLEISDAPFIHVNDNYYGTDMSTFIDQLKILGVKVDPEDVCLSLCVYLPSLFETPPIKRIYSFLKKFNWKPVSLGSAYLQVWIPSRESSNEGYWVDSNLCVLHDKTHHFAPIMYSLETYYENDLLPFFSTAFHVIESPSTSHFLQLWSRWETRETQKILESECCFFWSYILKKWNQEMQDTLLLKLTKVPALLPDGSALLVNREDVVVPDDVSLKNMFLGSKDSPLSVWLPKSSVFSDVPPSRLCAFYCAFGVKKISECVERSVRIVPSFDQLHRVEVDLKKKFIVKGLIKIVLGFLACKVHMPTKERHEAVKTLLSLFVSESDEYVRVLYTILLNSAVCLEREVVKLVHWDKKSNRLYINGSFSGQPKANAEFVNCFAAEIAEGFLPEERGSIVNDLRNLIQMGLLFEFQEHSIQYLLTKENIEVLVEDEQFLAAAFSVTEGPCDSGISKRASTEEDEPLNPLTPNVFQCVKRRRLDEIASPDNEGESKFDFNQADCKLSSQKKVEAIDPMLSSPKKLPMSPVVFMEDSRKPYKLEHPHNNSVSEVSSRKVFEAGSEARRAMHNVEKEPYTEVAEIRKTEYEKDLATYCQKTISGTENK